MKGFDYLDPEVTQHNVITIVTSVVMYLVAQIKTIDVWLSVALKTATIISFIVLILYNGEKWWKLRTERIEKKRNKNAEKNEDATGD